MALNNVTFQTVPGGLGRLPAGEDHVSAIMYAFGVVNSPPGWSNPIGKKYISLEEAEQDGIIDGDAAYGLLWYYIREFFRISGPSELYVLNISHGDYESHQQFLSLTEGRVRQVFWVDPPNYAGLAAHIAIVKAFTDFMETNFTPCVVITAVKDEATAVDGTQPDLRAMTADTVSVVIAGDASGKGSEVATSLGINYVPASGAILGALSRGQVHMNVAWVANFNLAGAAEMQRARLSDGEDIQDVPGSVLDTMNTRGYIFLRKHQGIAGTYANDTHTATPATDDLAYIENVRTIQKAKREIRTILLPDLNSPLTVDEAGKLAPDTVRYFETRTARPLTRMQNEGELSGFSVFVDPEQNVLASSQLVIQVKLQPRGVARQIKVTIGFAVDLT